MTFYVGDIVRPKMMISESNKKHMFEDEKGVVIYVSKQLGDDNICSSNENSHMVSVKKISNGEIFKAGEQFWEHIDNRFKVGDLLEIRQDMSNKQRRAIMTKYPTFRKCRFDLCAIVLKVIDDKHCMVAACTPKIRGLNLKGFDFVINERPQCMLVCTQEAYIVPNNLFSVSEVFSINGRQKSSVIVGKIIQQSRQHQKKNHFRLLKQKYELAAMNNDQATMKAIVDELGYAPVGRGKAKRDSDRHYSQCEFETLSRR